MATIFLSLAVLAFIVWAIFSIVRGAAGGNYNANVRPAVRRMSWRLAVAFGIQYLVFYALGWIFGVWTYPWWAIAAVVIFNLAYVVRLVNAFAYPFPAGVRPWASNTPWALLVVAVLAVALAVFGPKLGWSLPAMVANSNPSYSPGEEAILAAVGNINAKNTEQDQAIDTLDNRVTTVEEKVNNITVSADGKSIIVNAPVKTCEGLLDYQLVDLTELSSADNYYIHIQYGRDGKEYETLLPPGRYAILKPFADGHTWELGPMCTASEALTKHVGPSIARRIERKVASGGYVHWQTLVEDKTLEIIWQQPGDFEVPTSIPAATMANASTGTGSTTSVVGTLGKNADADGRTVGDDTYAYTIECWQPVSGMCVVPTGESISGVKGAVWGFPNTDAAMADAQSKGKPVFVAKGGKLDPMK